MESPMRTPTPIVPLFPCSLLGYPSIASHRYLRRLARRGSSVPQPLMQNYVINGAVR